LAGLQACCRVFNFEGICSDRTDLKFAMKRTVQRHSGSISRIRLFKDIQKLSVDGLE